jgi:CDP-6-deoxy-D-xylo-4-hexulose-3-dehydrase
MVNSGSSANLVMIAALKEYYGWSDGDEIIVSVVGFPTTVSAILQNNLVPVFVDISWDDLNWDVSSIVGKITPKTKALFSSPVLGNPYDFDWVLEICQKFDLKLIADNCDSLGSKWRGNYLTDYAVASSCSFYPAH